MKASHFLILFPVILFSFSSEAKTWTFANCQASLHSFPAGNNFEVTVSMEFSDQTGLGHGVARVNESQDIQMSCRFMTEMSYGLLGIPRKNEWILCETDVEVVNGLKFGIPFNVVVDELGRSINPVTYIQFETGSVGHGTLDGFSCLQR